MSQARKERWICLVLPLRISLWETPDPSLKNARKPVPSSRQQQRCSR